METLLEMAGSVAAKLRREQLKASTVKLKLRWPDFTTLTRQETLPYATDADAEIRSAAGRLFDRYWPADQPVRLLGIGVSGLDAPQQLSLWDEA
jgi:DNA polymerase-4